MSNQAYVVVSFGLTWLVVIGYLLHLRTVGRRAAALAARASREGAR